MRRPPGAQWAVLVLAFAAHAAPPPPPEEELTAKAQVVLTGEPKEWERDSWFWEDPERWRARVEVASCLKGCALLREPVQVELQVEPGGAGTRLTRVPSPGLKKLFLSKQVDGVWRLVEPELYAIQAVATPPTSGE